MSAEHERAKLMPTPTPDEISQAKDWFALAKPEDYGDCPKDYEADRQWALDILARAALKIVEKF